MRCPEKRKTLQTVRQDEFLIRIHLGGKKLKFLINFCVKINFFF